MRLKNNGKKIIPADVTPTAHINSRYFLSLAVFSMLIAFVAMTFNTYVFQFTENQYFAIESVASGFLVLLVYFAFRLLFHAHHTVTRFAKEFLYYFLVLNAARLLFQAAQLTPFSPIDSYLLWFDEQAYLHLSELMKFTHHHSHLYHIFSFVYQSITYQMVIIPIGMMCFKRFTPLLHEYYFLLLVTLILGVIFYYFFPTTAPASNIDSPYFLKAQYATGLKFKQIHDRIPPTTMDGGMVAFPSFHVIWAYLCLNLARGWPVLCHLLLPVNILLAFSCVFLGWHYPIDLLGSAIVILLAHALLRLAQKHSNGHHSFMSSNLIA